MSTKFDQSCKTVFDRPNKLVRSLTLDFGGIVLSQTHKLISLSHKLGPQKSNLTPGVGSNLYKTRVNKHASL